MKLLVITFAGFTLAHINNLTSHENGDLTPRAPAPPPQALSDPDNEGYWVELKTGKQTQKNRILEGLAPQDQKGRIFDWDETCTDPDERAKIIQAWDNMLILAQDSATAVNSLRKSVPNPVGAKNDDGVNQQHICDTDTAYTQMFKALDNALEPVENTYNMFDTKVKNPIGVGERPDRAQKGGLRFICNNNRNAAAYAADGVKDYKGRDFCADDTQAVTSPPVAPKGKIYPESIEAKFRFRWSTGIVFCPPFFDDTQFPSIDQRRADALKNPDVTLNDLDCSERILMHEYMHVPWMTNLNPREDKIGYDNAAQYADKLTKVISGRVVSLPDQWPWYAIYRSFNSQLCGKNGRLADVWPQNVPRPCPTKYPSK